MNSVNLIGRLVRDPELRFVPGSGMAVANFTLAIDKGLSREKKAEFEAQGKPVADFIRIVVWAKSAENCSQYLAKGKLCAVLGSIQTSSYKDKDDKMVFTTEVLANRVEFLDFGEKTDKPIKAEEDFSFGGKGFEDGMVEDDSDDDCPF